MTTARGKKCRPPWWIKSHSAPPASLAGSRNGGGLTVVMPQHFWASPDGRNWKQPGQERFRRSVPIRSSMSRTGQHTSLRSTAIKAQRPTSSSAFVAEHSVVIAIVIRTAGA